MDSQQLRIDSTATVQIYSPPDSSVCRGAILPGKCGYCNRNSYSVAAQASGVQRYKGSLTTEEAQAEINSLLMEIHEDIADLKIKLQKFGDLIASRWSKKSIDKRGQLLCASAGFCFGEWPPVLSTETSFKTHFSPWFPEESRKTSSLYASWIQAKEFAEDRSKLLTLLHLRTEHSPQSWAMYDTIGSGQLFEKASELPYNPHCVKMFGEDYGKLVSYNSELIHTSAIMSFPQALATIRGQHAISRALRQVLDNIVTDSAPSGDSKWKDIVLKLNQTGGETRWTSYDHPALVAPSGFDTNVLLSKATNKFNELCDDMQLMHTDPEYMLNVALVRKASIRSKDSIPTATKWNLVALDLFSNRFTKLIYWARVLDACHVLHEVFEEHRENIRPGTALPPGVGSAFRRYATYVNEAVEVHCHLFRDALMHMSALKDCFAVVKADRGYKWTHLRPMDTSKESDRLFAAALAIENNMRAQDIYGARMEVQLFLRKLSSIKYEKAVDEEISSLALLDELRLAQVWSQLGLFHMAPREVEMFSKAQAACESRSSTFLPPRDEKATRQTPKMELMQHPLATRLGPLLRKFCEAPWPKDQKSLTWLGKVTVSRKCLSNLWKAAREEWKAMEEVNGALHPNTQALIDSMSFDTTPEYLEEVRKEREEGEAEIHRMQAIQARQESTIHALQTTWGHADSSKMEQKSRRTKIKTTGTNTTEDLDISAMSLGQGEVGQTSNEDMTAANIPVRQESLVLFQKMFSSSTGSTPGSVKWIHLVQALTDAGLVATQAPGSAVAFSNGSAGAINFHKPHDSVVDAMMLRCMGKRLRKWFGWTGDRFVLRAKEGKILSK